MTGNLSKYCSQCMFSKPTTEFSKQAAAKDGLQAYCKPCVKARNTVHYLTNRDDILEYKKQYRKTNQSKMRDQQASHKDKTYKRHYKRLATDPLYKCRRDLRGLVYHSLNRYGYTKRSKVHKLLGADFATVQQHLIDTAIKNYGFYDETQKYHIDHVIPCSVADNQEELETLQFYYNLQYLTSEDNLAKGAKIDWSR